MTVLVRSLQDVSLADLAEVGGKNASLGEMLRELRTAGVKVPDGFAVTAQAYRSYVEHNRLEAVIRSQLEGLDVQDVDALQTRGRAIRMAFLGGSLPSVLRTAITDAYGHLGGFVAVRSSATAEDLPDASFAGQQETYLDVHGIDALLDAVRRCYASLFTDRAIAYRSERRYDHLSVALSVGVQRMVRSDLACAGVMFTLDTETGFRDAVLINGAWGLGETVVQGTVVPDEWVVFKPTLRTGHRPILRRTLGTKETKLVTDRGGNRRTRSLSVDAPDRARFVLTDDEVLALARQALLVEDHYSRRRGTPTPMDLEWAKDGETGELFVVQARPETVESRRSATSLEQWRLTGAGDEIATGRAVGSKIASGTIRVLHSTGELNAFQDGEVLVAERTDPDWEPVMRRASAVVTRGGGRTCHAAIVSRELGVPAIVGVEGALELLRTGEVCTVDCSRGETGHVLRGAVPFEVDRVDVAALRRPRTKIKLNVGNPDEAFRLSRIPNDGVGLAREEFIVTSTIGIHPMALAHFDRIDDPALRAAIDAHTHHAPDKAGWFVERLAEGVATIAAAFWPNEVLVRFSDFKTNEYAHLLGGGPFEPREENPMIGFRGASRYAHPRYRDGFLLECRAMRRVREEMGLENLQLMVPFCRTPQEGRAVVETMRDAGLVSGEHGLRVYAMCEIPSNVVRMDELAQVFDGFSIGSNDLTQLTLGVDRDSEILSHAFDERDPAVRWMIAKAIESAHRANRPIGICGQAPSDYPDFAAWLVGLGIDSISLDPDSVIRTTLRILEIEDVVHAGMPAALSEVGGPP